ncbi:MAG TPA: GNAT family protein [Microthrixaceae bacterium]|nr:GNAT family protein [Microthrixaceae bacterium]
MTSAWPVEPPTLDGDGVRLRAWRADDATSVLDACQSPDIQRWTTVPVPYLRKHADEFVERLAPEQWESRTGALFCVASTTSDRVLGSCGLVTIDADDAVAEVGYWVAPLSQGAGVAQKAVRLLAAWAMGQGGLHRLEFYIEPDNLASCAVAERVGCALEGVLRSKAVSRGTRVDLSLYALIT